MSQDVEAVRLLIAEALARKSRSRVNDMFPYADAVLELFKVDRVPLWGDNLTVVLTLAPATPPEAALPLPNALEETDG